MGGNKSWPILMVDRALVVTVHETTGLLSFPIAGVLWMVGYVFLIIGAVRSQWELGHNPTGISVVVAIFAIGVLVVDFIVLIAAPLVSSDTSIFQKVLELTLSVEGILLVIVLIFTLVTLKYEAHSRTWILLTGGLSLIAAANLTSSYLQIQSLSSTAIFSILWLPGSLFIGTTSVHELEAQKDRLEQKDDLRAA